MRLVSGFAILALASGGLLTACGRGESAERRQMDKLQQELARVQAEHDQFDQRLAAVELRVADDHDRVASKAAVPSAPTQPLRVVHLGPGQDAAAGDAALDGDDPDDTTPRPSIKISGRGGVTSEGRSSKRRGAELDQVVEETMPPESANGGSAGPAVRSALPGRPSALDPAARSAYDGALALVHEKKYSAALDAFAAFLLKWPDHPFADNATYWRGECYYALGDVPRAVEQFEAVIARFPLGNKAPDALLKLGISHQKLGDAARAQRDFDRLRSEYPQSEAARRVPTETKTRTERP